jgi:hypothetical protein
VLAVVPFDEKDDSPFVGLLQLSNAGELLGRRFVGLDPGAPCRVVLETRHGHDRHASALAEEADYVAVLRVGADFAEAIVERENVRVCFARDLGCSWVRLVGHAPPLAVRNEATPRGWEFKAWEWQAVACTRRAPFLSNGRRGRRRVLVRRAATGRSALTSHPRAKA